MRIEKMQVCSKRMERMGRQRVHGLKKSVRGLPRFSGFTVEEFNLKESRYYISDAMCNAFGAASFSQKLANILCEHMNDEMKLLDSGVS